MPAVFEQSGLRFDYPENWVIETDESLDELDEGALEVVVTSPDGAFWSVSLQPPSVDLHSLLKKTLDSMKEVYSDLDEEWVDDQLDSCELSGYDANFFCLDLTSTAQIRAFQNENATYLLLAQAEDRDFSGLEPVFRAMTTSMIRGLSQ